MDRRALAILLLVLVGCTGRRVFINGPVSTAPSLGSLSPPAHRTRTTLKMEVGPSVHPGSFRAAGTLTDGSGAPVVSAIVTVTLTPVGGAGRAATFDLGTRTTDEHGGFQVTFHPPNKGTFLVVARFAGDEQRGPASDQGPITAT